jgi:murein DD-endopeptidase MepM/ murein hydrolase activator NlpD
MEYRKTACSLRNLPQKAYQGRGNSSLVSLQQVKSTGPFLLCLYLCLFSAHPLAADPPRLSWEPEKVKQGEVVLIRVDGVNKAGLINGSFAGRPIRFFSMGSNTGVAALIGIDLAEKPGTRSFYVEAAGVGPPGARAPEASEEPQRLVGKVDVIDAKFRVQKLTLPRDKVDLDAKTLKRVRQESKRLKAALAAVTPEQLWQGGFILPVNRAAQPLGFGRRRVINGQPRSPHTGADITAPLGTAVVAANTGRVVLVDEQFFAGRLIVLDHGFGIHTMYFHLQKQHVREGEKVAKEQLIGTVGATGRATGPHLHFGVRVQDARVDPLSLLRLPLGP